MKKNVFVCEFVCVSWQTDRMCDTTVICQYTTLVTMTMRVMTVTVMWTRETEEEIHEFANLAQTEWWSHDKQSHRLSYVMCLIIISLVSHVTVEVEWSVGNTSGAGENTEVRNSASSSVPISTPLCMWFHSIGYKYARKRIKHPNQMQTRHIRKKK